MKYHSNIVSYHLDAYHLLFHDTTLQFIHWKFKIKVLLFLVFVKLSVPHSFVQNGILRL